MEFHQTYRHIVLSLDPAPPISLRTATTVRGSQARVTRDCVWAPGLVGVTPHARAARVHCILIVLKHELASCRVRFDCARPLLSID